MRFNLGKPILAMLLLSVVGGTAILLRPAKPVSDLSLWVFADSHAGSYRAILPAFERQTGRTVGVQLVPPAALNVRMAGLFMSGRRGNAEPDAVEVGMDSVAQYFRPPTDAIGFLPLNGYLNGSGWREIAGSASPGEEGWNARCRSDGKIYTFHAGRWELNVARARPDAWIDRVIAARFAPWTKRGQIYGVPHDVHPMTVTYRSDLFARAGIDLSAPSVGKEYVTWADFQDRCLRFQQYWDNPSHWTAEDGPPHPRHAIELFESSADHLVALLLQRGVNLIDGDDGLHLSDPITAGTLVFYAGLLGGPRQIAAESPAGTGPWVNDLIAGNTCAALTPDWRAHYLRAYGPALAGRLKMMPLPRFDPADFPTSTWSGTMIGIPRNTLHPDQAWKLIEYLYFSEAGLEARVKEAGIVPPLRDFWPNPILHQPDPFYGGQKVLEMYVHLAGHVPPKVVHWATPVAQAALAYVLNEAIEQTRLGRNPDEVLDYVRGELHRVQAYVRRVIEHGTFETSGDATVSPP